jgi:hypothetical protein
VVSRQIWRECLEGRSLTTHSTGARVSFSFIVNLDGFGGSSRPVNSSVRFPYENPLSNVGVLNMDKTDRVAVIVGMVLLAILILGALLLFVGSWAIGQGERKVLGPVSSPSVTPTPSPTPSKPDRLR